MILSVFIGSLYGISHVKRKNEYKLPHIVKTLERLYTKTLKIAYRVSGDTPLKELLKWT